jgi:hypothetical protein
MGRATYHGQTGLNRPVPGPAVLAHVDAGPFLVLDRALRPPVRPELIGEMDRGRRPG